MERHVRFLSSGKVSGNLEEENIYNQRTNVWKFINEIIKEHFSRHLVGTINIKCSNIQLKSSAQEELKYYLFKLINVLLAILQDS